jgi:hypothetical protein
MRYAQGGRLLQLSFRQSQAQEWNSEMFCNREKRGACKGFSRGSRRRLLNQLNTIRADAGLPLFVTLTLPDSEYVADITEAAKVAKRLLGAWMKRLARVCPEAAGFWRIEWQTRKSGPLEGKVFPHFHLMLWGLEYRDKVGTLSKSGEPKKEAIVRVRDNQLNLDLADTLEAVVIAKGAEPGPVCYSCRMERRGKMVDYTMPGETLKDVRKAGKLIDRLVWADVRVEHPTAFGELHDSKCMSFFDWASLSWYHVVDSHDVNHFLAGASVEPVNSWGGVMSYCSKYLAKLGDWEFMSEVALGRQWGIFNRANIPWAQIVEVRLDDEAGNRLRRICRRYLERVTARKHRYPFGVTLYCDTRLASFFVDRNLDPF